MRFKIIIISLIGAICLTGCKKGAEDVVVTDENVQNTVIDTVVDIEDVDTTEESKEDDFVDRNAEAVEPIEDLEEGIDTIDVNKITKADLADVIAQIEASRPKKDEDEVKDDGKSNNSNSSNTSNTSNKGGANTGGNTGGNIISNTKNNTKQESSSTKTTTEKKEPTKKKEPTPTPKPKSNKYAAVNLDGADVLVTVKVTGTKKGDSAEKILKDVEDENGATFGAIANKGYMLVVTNIKVTLPSSMTGYTLDCIPEIRIRDTKGKLINNEAVYVYVGELGEYDNSGLTKTYDIIYEIPEGTNSYMIQFGKYGADNYNYIVK